MKKYFAKYLPVEGEIKTGDKTLLPLKSGGYAVFTRIPESDPEGWGQITEVTGNIPLRMDDSDYVQYTHPKDLKKYQLFLCSRDIQVGDNIKADYFVEGDGEFPEYHVRKEGKVIKEAYTDHWEIDVDGYLEYAKKHGCFKVIGPISPQALWTKEGMEFDEDDLQRASVMEDYRIIKIKCPTCKTFH